MTHSCHYNENQIKHLKLETLKFEIYNSSYSTCLLNIKNAEDSKFLNENHTCLEGSELVDRLECRQLLIDRICGDVKNNGTKDIFEFLNAINNNTSAKLE